MLFLKESLSKVRGTVIKLRTNVITNIENDYISDFFNGGMAIAAAKSQVVPAIKKAVSMIGGYVAMTFVVGLIADEQTTNNEDESFWTEGTA